MSQDVYQLLDCGDGRKLERLGPHLVERQAAGAFWPPTKPVAQWPPVAGRHHRTNKGGGYWKFHQKLPESWVLAWGGLEFKIKLTDFGHIGLFPEQSDSWTWLREQVQGRQAHVLNLFAYTGGSTLACAQAGAEVTHVDASKGAVAWARENAEQNQLAARPIRWIVEDVSRYLRREIKRGTRYQGLVLDPPSYGRGAKGETWKIETSLQPLLDQCRQLLDPGAFILLSCHTPGYTALTLQNILHCSFEVPHDRIESGEMVVPWGSGMVLPSGTYARCSAV